MMMKLARIRVAPAALAGALVLLWRLLLPASAAAQEPALTEEERALIESIQEIKYGVDFNALPLIWYNSDLGLGLGAFADIIDYGKNPSVYPLFRHKTHFELNWYTGGQVYAEGTYESTCLIPGIKFSTSLSYTYNPLYQFFGYNGMHDYNRDWDRRDGIAYYSIGRKAVKFINNFRGKIIPGLSWGANVNYYHFAVDDVHYRNYTGTPSLYREYRHNGLIRSGDLKGDHLEFAAGLNWDSRNSESSPSRGMLADLHLIGSPDIFKTGHQYLKLAAHFRQYLTPGPDWFTIAYHLGYQGSLVGSTPFYMLPNIYMFLPGEVNSDGLGGYTTVRGIMMGRLLGESYAWMNLELRFKIYRWQLLRREWWIGANPLFDMGAITRPYRPETMAAAYGMEVEDIRKASTRLHPSAGLGVQICFDRDYLITLEWAKPFNTNDGLSSIMVRLDYTF